MMARKKSKPAPKQMTKPLLRQINDHAQGGFILFNFDKEGLPQVHSNFEEHAHALALQYYVKSWADALDAATSEAMTRHILDPEDDEVDDKPPPEEEI